MSEVSHGTENEQVILPVPLHDRACKLQDIEALGHHSKYFKLRTQSESHGGECVCIFRACDIHNQDNELHWVVVVN